MKRGALVSTLFAMTQAIGAAIAAPAGHSKDIALEGKLLQPVIVSSVQGEIPTDNSKNVRIDETVMLNCVAPLYAGHDTLFYGPENVKEAIIHNRKRELQPMPASMTVDWFKVEPAPYHANTPAPNKGVPCYSNSQLYNGNHGAWLGFDKIDYYETSIGEGQTITADAHPTWTGMDVKEGLGTMRFKAVVTYKESEAATPGKESTNSRGITKDVHRISFRKDDSFTGYLTSFYNVPEVFGSTGPNDNEHQTEIFTGTDCADIIVGTARLMGAKVPYTYVDGLQDFMRPRKKERIRVNADTIVLDETGNPAQLLYGQDIEVGDIIPIHYPWIKGSGRRFEHVGVLFYDRSDPDGPEQGRPNGIFDSHDLIAHLGHYELKVEPLHMQAPFITQVWQWKANHDPEKPYSALQFIPTTLPDWVTQAEKPSEEEVNLLGRSMHDLKKILERAAVDYFRHSLHDEKFPRDTLYVDIEETFNYVAGFVPPDTLKLSSIELQHMPDIFLRNILAHELTHFKEITEGSFPLMREHIGKYGTMEYLATTLRREGLLDSFREEYITSDRNALRVQLQDAHRLLETECLTPQDKKYLEFHMKSMERLLKNPYVPQDLLEPQE